MEHSCSSPSPDWPDASPQSGDLNQQRSPIQSHLTRNDLAGEGTSSPVERPSNPEAVDRAVADQGDDIDRDTEAMGWNQLSSLGNHAIQRGLIIGHGFYKGQYEILRQGQALVMSPDEALVYLQKLIREAK